MKRAIFAAHCMLAFVLVPAWAVPSSGAILCQKRSGVLVVRTACKKKEVPVDVAALGLTGPKGDPGVGPLTSCAADAVLAGTVCLDKYEASVWRVPNPTTDNQELVAKIQTGVATAEELTAAGATQLGVASDDYAPCADNGQNCAEDVYAVSLPGVTPSSSIKWFQAAAACRNARKRLPTNQEWQVGAFGTPDPGGDDGTNDCNTASTAAVATGSRSNCVSDVGALDMVGNVGEWTADWVPRERNNDQFTACPGWGELSDDIMCLSGDPAALARGGTFNYRTTAGPLTLLGIPLSASEPGSGFRCAR